MYHDMGLIACTVAPLVLGQTIVLLDPFEWVASPRILFDAITRHRGTLCWLPNFGFELLAKTVAPDPQAHDLSSIRAFVNCSEPCKPATFERFAAHFAPIGITPNSLQVSYAMAETVFAVTQTDPGSTVRVLAVDAARLATDKVVAPPAGKALELLSNGLPIDGVTVTIASDDGQALPADRVGEIEIESAFLFDGYYRRDELTKQRFRNGRYRSGDVGFMHDGELYVLGRTDDLIIVHGRNYFAHEIEALANQVEGLKPGRNVAVGVSNEAMGSLEIILIGEALPEANVVHLKRNVKLAVSDAMNLGLRDVVIVPPGWLVKSTSGKISRSANLDKYLAEKARKTQPRGTPS
jgi:acyl-CoA synthetase (AMP-forming)/AMP-acid ligase II